MLGHLNRAALEGEAVEVLVDGTGGSSLLLPVDHVLDVTAVVEDPRSTALELEVDVAVDWNRDGILTRLDGGTFRRRSRWYSVELSHGLDEHEIDAVKLVVLRVAARAVVNPEGLATESMGGYVSGFAFDETRLPTLAAPDRRDLDRYRVELRGSATVTSAGS